MADRPYEIVVWGATGFTGRLVAEYLVRDRKNADDGLRIALGGRNKDKLEALAADLGVPNTALIIGDSHDPATLEAMAKATKVVITTVGPYSRHGEALVAACVKHGTDYCDLTGEPQFIRTIIDAHHAAAQQSGARIVNCCGYDSIPSDLGTLMVQEAMMHRHGRYASQVKAAAGKVKGKFSGGTFASLVATMEQLREQPELRRVLGDPYGLNPKGMRGPTSPDQKSVRFDDDFEMWTAPFVMAIVNTRVVRRSHALMGQPWGDDFRYSECMTTGSGPRGLVRATAITGGLAGLLGATALPLTRSLVARKAPAPGEGPNKREREAGMFEHDLIAIDGEDELRGRVAGDKDPGYGSTAIMLGEAGLCLARDELGEATGVLTPASAMGTVLIERLRRAGMTFVVRD